MNKKLYKDEGDLYEPTKIMKLNSDIKKIPIFSHYIWTHDIHSLERVKHPEPLEDDKPEDPKLGSKSQPTLNHALLTSPKKEDHEDEEDTKSKYPKKKTQIQRTLNECLEKVNDWCKADSSGLVTQKVEELVQEINQKKAGLNRDLEVYNELFSSKMELMPATTKKNQEFIDRIKDIQMELRPGVQKLPLVYESLKVKNKPAKVSGKLVTIEPSLLLSGRIKIQQLKEIEMKQKLNTCRSNLNKVPFSLVRSSKEL